MHHLGAAHWVYLAGIAVIVLTMILRANVVVPSIVATFLVTLAWTHSPVTRCRRHFQRELRGRQGAVQYFPGHRADDGTAECAEDAAFGLRMVEPFRAVMRTATRPYFILAAITYVISLFFWPTPAVPLVSAVLLPAAIAVGCPPLGGGDGDCDRRSGHGVSSDYVIGVAPGISAKAAGPAVTAAVVADRALALSLIMGFVALCSPTSRSAGASRAERGIARTMATTVRERADRLEAEGTFDKAEIARATSYERKPLAIDEKSAPSLAATDTAAGVVKIFCHCHSARLSGVITLMVLRIARFRPRASRVAKQPRSSAGWQRC